MTQMTAQIEKTDTSLTMKRVYQATPAQLFAAWTEPAQMNQWFHPSDQLRTVSSVNLKPGGDYRIEMHHPEGAKHIVVGTYQEIVPGEKLVFTWAWVGGEAEGEMLVTVHFNPITVDETELVLTHQRFINHDSRDSHEQGWLGTLNELEKALVG